MTLVSLSSEEKISLINSHIKNIQFTKYNAELSIIEENAAVAPNTETLASFTAIIAKSDAQVLALQAEIDALTV